MAQVKLRWRVTRVYFVMHECTYLVLTNEKGREREVQIFLMMNKDGSCMHSREVTIGKKKKKNKQPNKQTYTSQSLAKGFPKKHH